MSSRHTFIVNLGEPADPTDVGYIAEAAHGILKSSVVGLQGTKQELVLLNPTQVALLEVIDAATISTSEPIWDLALTNI